MSGGARSGKPYEGAAPSIKLVVVSGIVLALATVAAFALMYGTYHFFEALDRSAAANEQPATRVGAEAPEHPPEPILQGAPGSRFELRDPLPEMHEMLEQERAALESYGWVDEDAGVVRLPIERAKELLLERGLPVRPVGDEP